MSCYVEKVIEIAKAEIGYLEKASNSNLDSKTLNAGRNNFTKYAGDLDNIPGFYNGKKNGYPWCDCFVDWCFVKAYGVDNAKKLLCQPNKSLGAGCQYSMNYYKTKGQLKTTPKIGDQIFFKDSSGEVNHTGLVYDVDKTYVYTIEGNTSSASGVVANGGGVFAKKYMLGYNRIAGYGRPAYDATPSKTVTVLEWQKAAIADGFKFPKYGVDGQFGAECESVAKKAIVRRRYLYKYKNLTKIVQRVVGVEADGLCGQKTVAAIKKYQLENGLVADGEVGLKTWKKILGIR
ncbi:MAG: CHAP domain-containing protein [Kiritimatiellae bacterium]|nr:CHAP domain-containing protein [Kiritimatiellia bacterium]